MKDCGRQVIVSELVMNGAYTGWGGVTVAPRTGQMRHLQACKYQPRRGAAGGYYGLSTQQLRKTAGENWLKDLLANFSLISQ